MRLIRVDMHCWDQSSSDMFLEHQWLEHQPIGDPTIRQAELLGLMPNFNGYAAYASSAWSKHWGIISAEDSA